MCDERKQALLRGLQALEALRRQRDSAELGFHSVPLSVKPLQYGIKPSDRILDGLMDDVSLLRDDLRFKIFESRAHISPSNLTHAAIARSHWPPMVRESRAPAGPAQSTSDDVDSCCRSRSERQRSLSTFASSCTLDCEGACGSGGRRMLRSASMPRYVLSGHSPAAAQPDLGSRASLVVGERPAAQPAVEQLHRQASVRRSSSGQIQQAAARAAARADGAERGPHDPPHPRLEWRASYAELVRLVPDPAGQGAADAELPVSAYRPRPRSKARLHSVGSAHNLHNIAAPAAWPRSTATARRAASAPPASASAAVPPTAAAAPSCGCTASHSDPSNLGSPAAHVASLPPALAPAVTSAFLSLRQDKLFSSWPAPVFDAFTALFTLREVRRYEVLFRPGLPSISFVVVIEGSVTLARPCLVGPIDGTSRAQPSGHSGAGGAAAAPMPGSVTRHSHVVRAGEGLGHAALALRPRGTAIPRRHTATVRERGWLMSVSRADLEGSPALRQALWRHGTMAAAEAREVACMLREAPLLDALGVLSPDALAEAARLFEYVELPAGARLQPRQDPPAYFQVLVGGDAMATHRMPGGEQAHSVLSESADACYFGDRAVLAGEKARPACGWVDALSPCQVIRVRAAEARALLAALPALRPLLRDRRRMRHSALANRLAMRTEPAGGVQPVEETDEPQPYLQPQSPKPEESSVLVTLGECDVGSEVALPGRWQPEGGGPHGRCG